MKRPPEAGLRHFSGGAAAGFARPSPPSRIIAIGNVEDSASELSILPGA
jgi:hypothetical protein